MNEKFIGGLVSVIIPTFNRRELVQEALASVVQQSWPNIEIIVIDDGSTDGTFESLTNWQNNNPEIAFTLLRQDNAGVAAARNNGLTQAKGEFLYMLDSDDLIFPDAIETLAKMLSVGNWPYSLANIHSTNENCKIIIRDTLGISQQSEQKIYSNQWMTHAALYRRSTLLESGLFNNSLVIGEDTEFQWRVVATSGLGVSTPKYIGLRRQHSFGHLSFNRSDLQRMRHSLQAQIVFRQWLKSRNLNVEITDMRYRFRILFRALQFGIAGDWESKNGAMSLFYPAANEPSEKMIFLRLITGVHWRPYFYFLFSIFKCVQGLRQAYLFMGRVRYIRHSGTKTLLNDSLK